jgi:predicted component of type VI protein secretion system
VLSEIEVEMTTSVVTMPSLDDQLLYDHPSSAIAREQQKHELNQLPACVSRDSSLFNSYRHRGSRNVLVKTRRKVISSSSLVSPAQRIAGYRSHDTRNISKLP